MIALVVTIVVLLILAGVSISLILDNNGIIQRSKDARREYGQARENEQADLNKVAGWIEKQANENGGGSIQLPDATEKTKPYLPNGFIKDEGTNLDNGLVIKDSVGNEYVWVEVPRSIEIYTTAGLNITEFSAKELDSIKADLVNYASDYREDVYDDTWYDGCGIAETGYSVMYNKMLKSVYQNGGFWIGRYEIGIDENTERSFGTDYWGDERSTEGQTPVIKKNKIPYTWIRCSQAENLAETFAPSGYTSSLMFGLQWDLVCKHLEVKGENPGTSADSLQTAIKEKGTDLGNYSDASFSVTNVDAMYSEDRGASWKKIIDEENKEYIKVSEKDVLLTTGAEERNSMLNIYDLAGNVYELTLEYAEYSTPVSSRGMGCSNPGRYGSIATRNSDPRTPGSRNKTYSSWSSGARVTLY